MKTTIDSILQRNDFETLVLRLGRAAAEAGDDAQVRLCELALDDPGYASDPQVWAAHERARRECARVIAAGEAMRDPTRTLAQANAILREEGALSWIGLRDEQKLGCSRSQHERWLVSTDESELRAWAKSVAVDE